MKAQGGQGLVSRYSLTPFSPENCVDIGYDQLLDTYFLQVRRNRDEGAGTQLIKAIGTGVGTPETQGQITDPSVLVMEAGSFAKIPDDLIFSLYADRKTEATRFASDPVVYLCMRNKSVWRSRIGKDWQSRLESSPISGVQLEIRPSSHHSMNYVVAKAILRDFLGSHDRARRVTPVFSDTVISNMPVNRNSILTEKMISDAVFEIESQKELVWIEKASCYAGEGKVVPAAEQLRRSDPNRKPREQCITAAGKGRESAKDSSFSKAHQNFLDFFGYQLQTHPK